MTFPIKMIVCRKPCGCVTAAYATWDKGDYEHIVDCILRGDTVKVELHETLKFGQCAEHGDK